MYNTSRLTRRLLFLHRYWRFSCPYSRYCTVLYLGCCYSLVCCLVIWTDVWWPSIWEVQKIYCQSTIQNKLSYTQVIHPSSCDTSFGQLYSVASSQSHTSSLHRYSVIHMQVWGCKGKFFGDTLCWNQAAFTLMIMYLMYLVLFFLNTFLWWIIWNRLFSIARLLVLGLSIWTPWKGIFHSSAEMYLCKVIGYRRYMEVCYKPKVCPLFILVR